MADQDRAEGDRFLGLEPGHFTQGKMTYDLRASTALHGIIERIPKLIATA